MVVLFAVLLRRKPGFLAEFLDKMAVGTEREEVPDVRSEEHTSELQSH